MGPNPKSRLRAESRTADMAIAPEVERYVPPPPEDCDPEIVTDISPDKGVEIRQAQRIQYGKVVDFAVTVMFREENGEFVCIYRMDTAHGEVHDHRFKRGKDGQPVEQHREVHEVIPLENGADTVTLWFDKACTQVLNDWYKHVERWKR